MTETTMRLRAEPHNGDDESDFRDLVTQDGCNIGCVPTQGAEVIVLRVNAHEQLLKALKDLVEVARPNIYPCPDKPDTPCAKLKRADAAIAAAEGK